MEIEDEELTLTLKGASVGIGMVVYSELVKRIERTRSLIDKTVQRLMGRTYQRTGQIAKMYKPFTPILAAPREGSFIISLKLGLTEGEQPLFFTAKDVINEIVTGIEMINEADEENLHQLIKDDAYFNHFVAMTRDMAPDGNRISLVGFTSSSKNVTFTRQQKEIELTPIIPKEIQQVELEKITVDGLLDFASSRTSDEIVGLTSTDGHRYNIVVREGMEDLVRAYYKQNISITGMFDTSKNIIYLSEINANEN